MKRSIFIIFIALMPIGAHAQTGFDISRNLEIFADIYRQLDMFYVDTLSADTAVRWAIDGMLAEIDPYTKFYPDNDQDELRLMATGRYAGIGALIRAYKKENRTVIEEPYEDCPAQEAGVRAGDVILTIDGKDIKGWTTTQVSQSLRGEPGTTFELRVQRPGEKKPRAFKITRRQIQLPCLPWYGIVDSTHHVGYLYLTEFTDKCALEVRHAILDMKQQGMTSLIFDLRGNTGGSLESAIGIANELLPAGSLIVYTQGRRSPRQEYRSDGRGSYQQIPLVILIDEGHVAEAKMAGGT